MAEPDLGRFYPESGFGGFSRIDGTIAFFQRVNALLRPEDVVLDVGCGSGEYVADDCVFRKNLRILKGKVRRVIGIDVDSAGNANPCIDEFRLIDGAQWPVDAESVDCIVCDNVLEHLADPEIFFAQCRRALKTGGKLCLRTPNARSYFGLLSRLIPDQAHHRALQYAQTGRSADGVFPKYYRCNTAGKLRRALRRHGFSACVYAHEAEPAYLEFNRLTYWLGTLHAKFAPECFKLVLFAFAHKN